MKLHAVQRSIRLLIGIGLIAPIVAQAAAFQNGSFESHAGPTGQYLGNVSVLGWTYNGVGYAVYTDSNQYGIPAQDGAYYISFGHVGYTGERVSQTFDTAVGQSLIVSFWLARQQGTTDSTEEVSVQLTDGISTYSQSYYINDNAWVSVALPTFVSGSASATLSFTNIASHGGTNWGLDGVSVAVVPEPGTFATLLVGLGIFGLQVRRRALRGTVARRSDVWARVTDRPNALACDGAASDRTRQVRGARRA
jgi:hypothetical protein